MIDPTLGLATAIVPSIFGAISGLGQKRQAKRLRANAVNPGFQVNSGVMQNAETLQNRFSNYQMPGYNQALNNIGQSSATAMRAGTEGASSSGDVLDLATRIAYGTGQQQRQLETQNAQGKEGAMFDYLGANAQAGAERQNANAYDRDQYNRQLDEAASLYNAGDTNIGNAINGASSIATSYFMNPALQQTGQSLGQQNGNPTLDQAKMSGAGITQQGVNTNPLFQYNALNPILQKAGGTNNIQNNGQPSAKPLIPLPRRNY